MVRDAAGLFLRIAHKKPGALKYFASLIALSKTAS